MYWDYYNQRFNFQGHICLSSTIAWGFLTILMTEIVHKPVEQFALAIPMTVLTPVVMAVTVVIVVDFTLSFKAAMDLRDVLVKLEKAKDELEHMQKRLDVLLALADEEISGRLAAKKQAYVNRSEELLQGIENRFDGIKEQFRNKYAELPEETREEIAELRMRFASIKDSRLQMNSVKDFYRRHLILDNPTMYSLKFKEALEELKKAATEHKRDGKGK